MGKLRKHTYTIIYYSIVFYGFLHFFKIVFILLNILGVNRTENGKSGKNQSEETFGKHARAKSRRRGAKVRLRNGLLIRQNLKVLPPSLTREG